MKTYDVSIRRRRYWKTEIELPHLCPKCQTPLIQGVQTYLMMVKQGNDVESYLTGNNGGWFCPKCPVIVLDDEEFNEAGMAVSGRGMKEYSVIGLVNVDAIPDDKTDLPLGDDDNPIPLVEFLKSSPHRQKRPKKQPITRKQRRQLKQYLKQKKT